MQILNKLFIGQQIRIPQTPLKRSVAGWIPDTNGIAHEVWFTNALNFKTFLDIVKQLNLRGIAIWHPGNDDPAIYDAIRNS